jgi:hypothetical protein
VDTTIYMPSKLVISEMIDTTTLTTLLEEHGDFSYKGEMVKVDWGIRI